MSALSVIGRVIIGIAAVAVPGTALFFALILILRGVGPFVGVLCIAFACVGGPAWVCVRTAHFSPRLAVILTTLPFLFGPVVTMRSLATHNPAAFFIQFVVLALAVLFAWAATRLARR
jgi:hypothetical protein